jgi:putative thiazole-containing bacteriocin maturation protein
MQPKFNSDTIYIPVTDGIYLRNNTHSLKMKGRSLYPLLKHLIPFLNGHYTLATITEGLDEEQAAMISNFIEKLCTYQFLTDLAEESTDSPPGLSATEEETYTAEIGYIASFQTSRTAASRRFTHFRNQRLLIIAPERASSALISACQHSGIQKIALATVPDINILDSRATPAATAAQCSNSDGCYDVERIDTSQWEKKDAIRACIQDYDVVLSYMEHPLLANARMLNTLCIEQKKTCIQAIVLDQQAWIGPLTNPETAGCWECAWLRLQEHRTDNPDGSTWLNQLQTQKNTDQFLIPSTRAIIANQLVVTLFAHLTRSGTTDISRSLTILQLDSLLSERHDYQPHPLCRACHHPTAQTAAQFLDTLRRLQQHEPPSTMQFLQSITEYTDPLLGIFSNADDNNFVQAPLAICSVNFSYPLHHNQQQHLHETISADTNTQTARVLAYQHACEAYAAWLVDPRRLPDTAEIRDFVSATIPAASFLTSNHTTTHRDGSKSNNPRTDKNATTTTDRASWTWAQDLDSQQLRLVPATLAFPALQPAASNSEVLRGVGSGSTWSEAICQALLDWSAYLTISQIEVAHDPYRTVDLKHTTLTTEGNYLLRLLNIAQIPLTIYNVTGTLQIPTFAFCSSGQVLTYSNHYDVAQALTIGFKRVLQNYQTTQTEQRAYGIPTLPDPPQQPVQDQKTKRTAPQNVIPATWSARQTWLMQRFQQHHLQALVVPLDHDPALTQLLPVVRILLVQQQTENG